MTNAGQDDELSNHEVPRGESVSNEVINKLISEAVNETVEISNVRYNTQYTNSTFCHLIIYISNH